MTDQRRMFAAGALLAAAAARPSALCLLSEVTASPLERALRSSWCGDIHAAAGPHCAACWIGAALLAALAGVIAMQPSSRRTLARAR